MFTEVKSNVHFSHKHQQYSLHTQVMAAGNSVPLTTCSIYSAEMALQK